MSKLHIERSRVDGRETIKRSLVTDADELRQSKALTEEIQRQLDDPAFVAEFGEARVISMMPLDMFNEAQIQVENANGGLLGNIARNEQMSPMEEFFKSKAGKDFMDV